MTDRDPLAAYLRLRTQLLERQAPVAGSWALLAAAMDDAVVDLSDPDGGMAVVAVGGYGRSQLCCFSDIDLMLVVADKRSSAPPVFRALWDAGLAVGHAVRTPAEAGQAAAERPETLCSLLDARLVGGSVEVFSQLQRSIRKVVRPRRLRDILADEQRVREASEPHHLQAANIKSGRGGLRTVQGLRWLAELEVADGVDQQRLDDLENRLLAVRQALHIAAGKRHDVAEFSLREPAAAVLGVEVRRFLTDVYATMRQVDAIAVATFGPGAAATPVSVGGRLFQRARSRAGDRVNSHANPWRIAADAVTRNPDHPTVTSDEWERLSRFDGDPWDEASRAAFVELAGCGSAGRRMFDHLSATGFLKRAIPEWTDVVSQPQLDPFHLHPLDDHLWRTAAEVVNLAGPESDEPWARDVAEELGSLDEVILGAFFHDIGKGTGRDHSIAGSELVRSFGERSGFDAVTVDVVSLLVREHLLLPQVATRHDLDDHSVVGGVAERVGDPDVLRMLYLLTVADARATGPDVWTPWRASLIRTLFARAIEALAGTRPGPAALRSARIAEIAERLVDDVPADQISLHLAEMPETYALRTAAREVRRHLLMLTPPPSGDDVRIDVVDVEEWSDVVLVTLDRTGLLSLVSGVMALSNISILEARLATRNDGIVVDRFNVVDSLRGGPVAGERWTDVVADLRAALAGDLALADALDAKHAHYRSLVDETAAPEARIVDGADHGTHRIELRAADRVGLLHDVARVFHDMAIDVRFAKIDTQGSRVVDTFHVYLAADTDRETLEAAIRQAAEIPQV